MSPSPATVRLGNQLQRIHAQGAGMVDVIVVQQDDMPALVAASLSGDSEALRLCCAVGDALREIQSAPKLKPMLCTTCDRALIHTKFALGVTLPRCDNPHSAIAMAVCVDCASELGEIRRRAIWGLAKIWPNLREITVTHKQGGRA